MKATNKRTIWVWLSIAVVLFLGLGLIVSGSQPKEYTNYLSKSPSPTGIKAFYTYMKEEKQDVKRWYGTPDKLKDDTGNQTLFMTGPYFRFDQEEGKQYTEWMEQGNTIVLLKQDPVGYFDVKIEGGAPVENPVVEVSQEGNSYKGYIPHGIRLQTKEEDTPLWTDERGTIALERPIGEGKLIVAVTPDWVTNELVLEEEHVELLTYLVNQANSDTILFDEYVHGQDNMPGYISVFPKGLLVFVLQLGLLTVLFVWMKGKRFGSVYLPRSAQVRYGDERLRALAAWYMRSELYADSLSIQEQYVRHVVHERYGVPVQWSWEDIVERISPRLQEGQVEQWKKWQKELEYVRHATTWSKKDYLYWSKKLDDIQKGVQEG
ncbi:DUF4350 domain-containing protein [Pontibacillus salicampi]|uniref:DUF4350 domain-containing protein n=1 Tax=Pontibacillus salicampi TaxID=1449801 RepID=A0ABV6LUF7_9BACI